MQISDRLSVSASFGGTNIGYRYMPKTHIGTPLVAGRHGEVNSDLFVVELLFLFWQIHVLPIYQLQFVTKYATYQDTW